MTNSLQITDTQDLIGPLQSLESLIEEYAQEDQVYRQKLSVSNFASLFSCIICY